MGIGSTIKIVAILLIVSMIGYAGWYITGLRADLAVSQENTKKMNDAIIAQQEAIKTLKADQESIRAANEALQSTITKQNKDLASLNNRFETNAAGQARDIGEDAVARPAAVQRAINRGTANAFRCIELASGAPLTETERNATTPDQINRECPSLANPNYRPGTSN